MPSFRAHYCHACAAARGFLYPLPENPLATSYQMEKYAKHTVIDPTWGVQGIFTSTEAKAYKDYVVDARAAGGVIVDGRNRFNIVMAAGKEIGYQYEHGRLVAPADAIQLVLSSEAGMLHAYPIQSAPVVGLACSTPGCERPVLVV